MGLTVNDNYSCSWKEWQPPTMGFSRSCFLKSFEIVIEGFGVESGR